MILQTGVCGSDLFLIVPRILCALVVGADRRDHSAADFTESLHDALRRQTRLGVVIPTLLYAGAQQLDALMTIRRSLEKNSVKIDK